MADAVVVPVQNDSSDGLARMYSDLEPLAQRVRSSACWLLFFSMMFCGTLEGMCGLFAAAAVLCCAAPGSLGTAYASRCSKTLATITAVLALFHLLALSTFSFVVLPEVPHTVAHMCAAKEAQLAKMEHGTAPAGKLAGPAIDLHDLLLAGHIFAERAEQVVPAKTPLLGADPATFAPKAMLGTDEATYTPMDMKEAKKEAKEAKKVEKKALLGADEATYAPMSVEVQVIEDGEEPSYPAKLVAAYSSKAARKLEALKMAVSSKAVDAAPLSEHCHDVAHFMAEVAPPLLLCLATLEFGLFLSALTLAKRQAHLLAAARRYGANAV